MPIEKGALNLGLKHIDQVILQLVENGRIPDQQSMVTALEEQGFSVNQSTLSRHLKKLNIRKQEGFYRYVRNSRSNLGDNYTNLVTRVVPVPPSLLVVKTLPGHANAVSYHFEKLRVQGVVGAVAGDDTMFVAVKPPEVLNEVLLEISKIFGLNQ